MSGRKRKRYDDQFQKDAVEQWIKSNKSAAEVARNLGISEYSLHRWKNKYLEQDGPLQDSLKAENERLRRENAELKQEREILKKSVGIFSKAQK